MTSLTRRTRETEIHCTLTAGAGQMSVRTGDRFLDHMVETVTRYASFDLNLDARGDLRHHLVEDVAIVMGQAVAALVTPTVTRFADRTVPMDDALVQVVIDLGVRAYYRGPLPNRLYDHWMRSFASNARATMHVRVLRGRDRHHIVEAGFKGLGLALRDALHDRGSIVSTKGPVLSP